MSIAEKLTTIAENIPKVYAAGQQNGSEPIWDAIQGGGSRVDYENAFVTINFSPETFKPLHSFKPTKAAAMFRNCPSNATFAMENGQVDMKALEESQGITFDFSEVTNFTQTFTGALFSALNVIDISKATTLAYAFYGGYVSNGAVRLKRIERLICSETSAFVSNTFNLQSRLEYIGFEGVIAKSLTLTSCPLVPESMKKAILCLKSFAGTSSEYSCSIKFSDECWATLEADSTAPNGGTWKDYVYNVLCWNY